MYIPLMFTGVGGGGGVLACGNPPPGFGFPRVDLKAVLLLLAPVHKVLRQSSVFPVILICDEANDRWVTFIDSERKMQTSITTNKQPFTNRQV